MSWDMLKAQKSKQVTKLVSNYESKEAQDIAPIQK